MKDWWNSKEWLLVLAAVIFLTGAFLVLMASKGLEPGLYFYNLVGVSLLVLAGGLTGSLGVLLFKRLLEKEVPDRRLEFIDLRSNKEDVEIGQTSKTR